MGRDYRGNQDSDTKALSSFMQPVYEALAQSRQAKLKQMLQDKEIGATRSNIEFTQGQENQRQQAGFTHEDAMQILKQNYEKELLDLQTKAHITEKKAGAQIDLSKEKQELDQKYAALSAAAKANPNSIVELAGAGKIDNMTPAIKAGQEAQTVFKDFGDRTKPQREDLDSVQKIKQLLSDPNNMDAGTLQSELTKLTIKGRVPVQEYSRVFPNSLKQDVGKAATYLGIDKYLPAGMSKNVLTDTQRQWAAQQADAVEKQARGEIERSKGEFSSVGQQIAPALSAQGGLQPMINSLGSQYTSAPNNPATRPDQLPKDAQSPSLSSMLTPKTQQPQQAPSNYMSPPPKQPTGRIRVKHKQTGQTGTIESNEFDPSIYEQVQ